MVCGQEDLIFAKHETSLFLLTFESARFVIETADVSIGQDQFMNQELVLYKQITIVFVVSSIYDELKTQFLCFIKEAVTRLFVRQHAGQRTGQGGHDQQVVFRSKGNPRLLPSRRRLLATEFDLHTSGQPE